jgi:hypothetical protein
MALPKKLAEELAATHARMTWDSTHGGYLAGRSHLDGVDHLAAAMEQHWGCDRLRLLVPTELREKFDRQRYRLQQARAGATLDILVEECRRMARALNALDANARAAGAMPQPATVWETVLSDGTVAAIVQDDGTAKDVVADGRAVSVWTLAEIGRLIDGHGAVVKAKLVLPGASVVAVRRSVPDPLQDIPHPGDFTDPMPLPLEELA